MYTTVVRDYKWEMKEEVWRESRNEVTETDLEYPQAHIYIYILAIEHFHTRTSIFFSFFPYFFFIKKKIHYIMASEE